MVAMTNLYIPMCGFLVAILLVFIFFSKERIKTNETKLFSGMLIVSLIDSLMMVTIITIAYLSKEQTGLLKILNKIDYVQFILWIWFFYMYIFNVTYGKTTKYKLMFNITLFINIIFIALIVVSPVILVNSNNIMYSYGPSANIMYIGCAFYIALSILILVINIKKIITNTKKFIPFYVFLLMAIFVMLLHDYNPALVIVSAVLAYIDLIMMFTIENPDVKMMEQLTSAKMHAEKANRAKSDFLSSMSHEIRTPLNAIVGFSEDIKDNSAELPERIKEDSEYIMEASQTLLEIVGNILDISKIESEKLEIINVKYDPKKEIEALSKVMATRIGEKPIDYKLEIAEDIPYELIGDKVRVKQVINNLLSNAIKYTDAGNIWLRINCINNNGISLLKISCQDTGRGIKAEQVKKLFNKFERLDIEKNTTTEGTGLGLAITKQLVEMMGGKINVSSTFGKGSIFIATIPQKINLLANPIEKKVSEEKVITLEQPKEVKFTKSNNDKRVLIVDDNILNIKVAKRSLEGLVGEVDSAISGKECLDKINNGNKYDLILMDIMMPEMSGETTLKELFKIEGFNTPVIAVTADTEVGSKNKYLSEGFNNYIAKPFKKEEIKRVLDEMFDNDIELL